MYYTELDNAAETPLTNAGPFTNMMINGGYWSGTAWAPGTTYDFWIFDFWIGNQGAGLKTNSNYAWAVRPGARDVIEAAIDIKPGGFPNSINRGSKGSIPVAVLSSPTFGAPSIVDTTSLTFGRTGNETSLDFCSSTPEDVNGDGLLDVICHFKTEGNRVPIG
jgi:hypothetical protein